MIGPLDCVSCCKSCDLLYRPIRSNLLVKVFPPLLWVTWLTRLVYDAQLKTLQLDDTLTYHGVTDQGPLWCGLSATFQISWVNSTILLNSSSAAYKNWRKKQFIFLWSTMACSQTLYLLFRDRGVFIAFFIFSGILRSFSHARFTRTLDKKRVWIGYAN